MLLYVQKQSGGDGDELEQRQQRAAVTGVRDFVRAGAAGAGALGRLPCDTVSRVVCRISGSGTVSVLSAA